MYEVPKQPDLTDAQLIELQGLIKEFGWPEKHGKCPHGSKYGPHWGTSCELRLLRYLRFQKLEK
jgi:hypothetical protein